jgi:hypothetical protein
LTETAEGAGVIPETEIQGLAGNFAVQAAWIRATFWIAKK